VPFEHFLFINFIRLKSKRIFESRRKLKRFLSFLPQSFLLNRKVWTTIVVFQQLARATTWLSYQYHTIPATFSNSGWSTHATAPSNTIRSFFRGMWLYHWQKFLEFSATSFLAQRRPIFTANQCVTSPKLISCAAVTCKNLLIEIYGCLLFYFLDSHCWSMICNRVWICSLIIPFF